MNISITKTLAAGLIQEQFPAWADLPVHPVAVSGWDNRTFHLGDTMLIRMPSAAEYAENVLKEQQWLPVLAPHLSIQISQPIGLGKPSAAYPWYWSIYRWIEGESANIPDHLSDAILENIALGLAQFLQQLHAIPTTGAPLAGTHNFYRGGNLAVYDAETQKSITRLRGLIDTEKATECWQKAVDSAWTQAPVWVHGDLSAGNILINNNKLHAIIDFGCMAIGDPACDLVIAWTLLSGQSRDLFIENVAIDAATWNRARGWALWKALIRLDALKGKSCNRGLILQKLIKELVA